jgi:hypothetical protein
VDGEIRAQKINNAGAIQWSAGGSPVCTNFNAVPVLPGIVKSNTGTAIINWLDSRNGTFIPNNLDIYAAKITANGSLAGAVVSYISATAGNWNVGGTWIGGQVPAADANVIVRHDVKVTASASCNSLKVEQPAGKLTVNAGISLSVLK